jgi:energy-coupling factor transporter ATP-binding protein EcfA2
MVPASAESLVPALRNTADALGSFSLDLLGRDTSRQASRSAVRDYLLPRLVDSEDSLVVAIVGGSGSGKSTLLNSLAQQRLSAAGPIRPTTDDLVVWSGRGLPPTLGGFASLMAGQGLRLDPRPPEGLVLVDTPPPQVVGGDGKPVAESALCVADVCMFVASGIRYADAAGWRLLELAAERDLPIVFVLNRLTEDPETERLLRADLAERLSARGLVHRAGSEAVVTVAEGPVLPATSGLPSEWVKGLRKEVEALADAAVRRSTIGAVVEASLTRLRGDLGRLRSDLLDDAVARVELIDQVRIAYGAQGDQLAALVSDGEFRGLCAAERDFASDLAAIVVRRASRAAGVAAELWDAHPVGALLMSRHPDLWTHGAEVIAQARAALDEWMEDIRSRIAESWSRWRRMRRRALERCTLAVAAGAIDPAHRPVMRTVGLVPGFRAAVEQAQVRLAEVIRGVLGSDAVRFAEVLGSPPPGAALGRLHIGEGAQ